MKGNGRISEVLDKARQIGDSSERSRVMRFRTVSVVDNVVMRMFCDEDVIERRDRKIRSDL